VSIEEVTRFLTGQADVIPTLEAAFDRAREANTKFNEPGLQLGEKTEQLLDVREAIYGARDANLEANGTWEDQEDVVKRVASAMRDSTSDTNKNTDAQQRAERQADRLRTAFDKIEGALDMQQAMLNFQDTMMAALERTASGAGNTEQDILDIKQAIVDVAAAARLTPIEVRSLLDKVDSGDLAGVKSDIEGYYARNKATIETELKPPAQHQVTGIRAVIRDMFGTIEVPVVAVPRSGSSYRAV
jgi:hypothetical protein